VLLERRSLRALLDLLKPSAILSVEEVTPAGWTRRVLSAKDRRAYDALRKKWGKKLSSVSVAVEGSERLTAEDYAVTINAR
jgi:hypothetical protein